MHFNSKVVTSSEVGLVYSCDFNSILRPELEDCSQQRSSTNNVVHPPILSLQWDEQACLQRSSTNVVQPTITLKFKTDIPACLPT